MKVHLGCSDVLLPGWLNVDVMDPWTVKTTDGAGYLQMDLRKPWDLGDSCADIVRAHDVFEHIDNKHFRGQRGIVWCMNEAHRILKPGGILDLVVPCYPGIAPWCDPTHVQVWTKDTRYYFDERWNHDKGERGRLGPAYGITALFETLPDCRSGVDWTPIKYGPDPDRNKLFLMLRAVK